MQRQLRLARWAMVGAIAMGGLAWASPTRAGDSFMETFSKESKQLAQQAAGTMLRVHVDPNPEMSPGLKAAYEKWQKDQTPTPTPGRRGPGGGAGTGDRGGTDRGGLPGAGSPGAGGIGARGGMAGAGAMGGIRSDSGLRRFLEQQSGTPAEIAEMRALLARLDAVRNGQTGDIGAVLIDNQGHALVLTPLLKDKTKPLQVTLADGTETTATVTGVDFVRGMSIIKLDKMGATSTAVSDHIPEPGEPLMGISANRGTIGWDITPIPGKTDTPDDRFPLTNPESGPTFLFDVTGKLVAISVGGRQALPMATLDARMTQLLKGTDIIPSPIGIRYTKVDDKSVNRLTFPKLGEQPAVKIDGIIKGSLAERAGFKTNDFLLTIDGKPLSAQFFTNPSADLEGRTGTVKFGILRDDKEVELEVTLDGATTRP